MSSYFERPNAKWIGNTVKSILNLDVSSRPCLKDGLVQVAKFSATHDVLTMSDGDMMIDAFVTANALSQFLKNNPTFKKTKRGSTSKCFLDFSRIMGSAIIMHKFKFKVVASRKVQGKKHEIAIVLDKFSLVQDNSLVGNAVFGRPVDVNTLPAVHLNVNSRKLGEIKNDSNSRVTTRSNSRYTRSTSNKKNDDASNGHKNSRSTRTTTIKRRNTRVSSRSGDSTASPSRDETKKRYVDVGSSSESDEDFNPLDFAISSAQDDYIERRTTIAPYPVGFTVKGAEETAVNGTSASQVLLEYERNMTQDASQMDSAKVTPVLTASPSVMQVSQLGTQADKDEKPTEFEFESSIDAETIIGEDSFVEATNNHNKNNNNTSKSAVVTSNQFQPTLLTQDEITTEDELDDDDDDDDEVPLTQLPSTQVPLSSAAPSLIVHTSPVESAISNNQTTSNTSDVPVDITASVTTTSYDVSSNTNDTSTKEDKKKKKKKKPTLSIIHSAVANRTRSRKSVKKNQWLEEDSDSENINDDAGVGDAPTKKVSSSPTGKAVSNGKRKVKLQPPKAKRRSLDVVHKVFGSKNNHSKMMESLNPSLSTVSSVSHRRRSGGRRVTSTGKKRYSRSSFDSFNSTSKRKKNSYSSLSVMSYNDNDNNNSKSNIVPRTPLSNVSQNLNLTNEDGYIRFNNRTLPVDLTESCNWLHPREVQSMEKSDFFDNPFVKKFLGRKD